MPDLSIASAASLTGDTIAEDDLLPVLDVSASSGSKGSRITLGEMAAHILADAALLDASNIFSVGGAASTPALSMTGSIFTGGSSATTKPHLLIEPAGTTSTGWSTSGSMLGLNAPSGFTGDIFRASYNGLMVLKMGYDSNYSNTAFTITTAGGTVVDFSQSQVVLGSIITPSLTLGYGQIRAQYGIGLILGSSSSATNGDNVTSIFGQPSMTLDWGDGAILASDAAHILSQRNSTNSQSLRVYGTYTDSSNYERLSFVTSAGAYSIKPEAAGTGTLRELHISGLPTSNPGPGILWNNSGTPAIGT